MIGFNPRDKLSDVATGKRDPGVGWLCYHVLAVHLGVATAYHEWVFLVVVFWFWLNHLDCCDPSINEFLLG